MDTTCLDYCLTDDEREAFEKDGFFAVEDALPPQLVEGLKVIVERLDTKYRAERGLEPHAPLNLLDFVGKDERFLELLDWPKTFPKVWGILGWNVQLYHSHLIVTHPRPADEPREQKRLGWHQDSGRLNFELEGNPRPRVSLKIGFFLSDTSVPGRGNFSVIPGSHLRNKLEFPPDGISNPEGARPICVPPGAAVFFDRRLWHSASPNYSDITRMVLFYGYSYRWLRPRDNMTVEHFMDKCDPVRKQLLGASTGGMGYTSPGDEDAPLRPWLREHLGESAVTP